MKNATLISLFAGAGGLDIGLEQAGFSTLVVSELAHHACETLRQNKALATVPENEFDIWFEQQLTQRCYKNLSSSERIELRSRLKFRDGSKPILNNATVIEGDIRNVSSAQLMSAAKVKPGNLTLVAGGPPCQPFSRAGKRHTVETEDGRLFLEFVRVVNDLRPRWFLFENVKGLAQSKTMVPHQVCKICGVTSIVSFSHREAALANDVDNLSPCKTCGSKEFLIENKDERGGSLSIILAEFEAIGYKCQYKILNSADFGVPQSRERLFIVGSRDCEDFLWPESTHFSPATVAKKKSGQNSPQLSLLVESPTNFLTYQTVKDILWRQGHPKFGKLDLENARLWVKNIVRPHDEPVTWSLDRPSPTVGAHQAAKLALAPYGIPPEQLARQQWHTKGHRQRDLPPVAVEHAMLSDEDLLRLQTFPPYWYLYGTRMERAFQIGNAVPPILAKVVGAAILLACNPQCRIVEPLISTKVLHDDAEVIYTG